MLYGDGDDVKGAVNLISLFYSRPNLKKKKNIKASDCQ